MVDYVLVSESILISFFFTVHDLYNFILSNTSKLQTNLSCHCVMFICVICHVTRAMWPIELVFIINHIICVRVGMCSQMYTVAYLRF